MTKYTVIKDVTEIWEFSHKDVERLARDSLPLLSKEEDVFVNFAFPESTYVVKIKRVFREEMSS